MYKKDCVYYTLFHCIEEGTWEPECRLTDGYPHCEDCMEQSVPESDAQKMEEKRNAMSAGETQKEANHA
jgi:hypothetical protein